MTTESPTDRVKRMERDGEDPAGAPPVACDSCGAMMLEQHCKLVCPRCGYTRDCSDP